MADFKLNAQGNPDKPFKPSKHLELADIDAVDLEEKDLYMVGHPATAMKKFSKGRLTSSAGHWFDHTSISYVYFDSAC